MDWERDGGGEGAPVLGGEGWKGDGGVGEGGPGVGGYDGSPVMVGGQLLWRLPGYGGGEGGTHPPGGGVTHPRPRGPAHHRGQARGRAGHAAQQASMPADIYHSPIYRSRHPSRLPGRSTAGLPVPPLHRRAAAGPWAGAGPPPTKKTGYAHSGPKADPGRPRPSKPSSPPPPTYPKSCPPSVSLLL